jgi:putative tricarboxylic transport membrane protein
MSSPTDEEVAGRPVEGGLPGVSTSAEPPLPWYGPKVVPVFLVLLGVVAAVMALQLSLGEPVAPGPGAWPFLCSAALVLFAATTLFIDDAKDYERWTRGALVGAAGVASVAVFILLFESVGFIAPAFLLLVLWLKVFGKESWAWTLALAVGISAALYVCFAKVLQVPFPHDVVLRVFGL